MKNKSKMRDYRPSTEAERKREEHLRNHYRLLAWLNKQTPALLQPQHF